jgi:hypothetical protein
MLKLKTPASIDRARIDAILEEHECSGEAMLVKARVHGGGYQVRIQCLTCGDHLGSALSQAAHAGWRDYPETVRPSLRVFMLQATWGRRLLLRRTDCLDAICSPIGRSSGPTIRGHLERHG